ncbi:arginine--tRNA ligase [Anaerolineales bacterium]
MHLLPGIIAERVEKAIKSAQAAGDLNTFEIPSITITAPKHISHGDRATAIALQLAKVAGQKPLDIAQIIHNHLDTSLPLSTAEVAAPGFINFRLDENWLRQSVEDIIQEGEALFQLDLGRGKRAQVEFVSANPSGPLAVHRSRGAIVGDATARVLEAAGYEVHREYYFNNAGQQMVMLGNSLKIRYLEALGQDVQIPAEDDTHFYQGDYLIEFAQDLVREQGDQWLDKDWEPFKEYAEKRMFQLIRDSLAGVNIKHDDFFNENSLFETNAVWDTLKALEAKGVIYRASEWEGATDEEKEKAANKAPATWFRSTAFGDDKDRVVVKADGIPTYTLPDIAYHINKLDRGFDLLVNVLGADHGTQYKVVQWGVEALGYDPSIINVIIVQMVRAVRNGVEFKMSTRRGVFDTLDDLIAQTSADAVRYYLLARSPNSQLDFDLDSVIKQSSENPVYYNQNAYVRCVSIAREAAARGLTDANADLSLLGEEELSLIRKIFELGEIIELAANNLEAHRIAFYAQELANLFHPIYDQVRALHTEVPEATAIARLRFYKAAEVTFKRLLDLMGMSAPERM